jgi:hypothetical protein
MVLESSVWGPHSLHTAEATGSKPVTPTSTNAFPEPLGDAACQQIASKSLTEVTLALKALPDPGRLSLPCPLRTEPGSAQGESNPTGATTARVAPSENGL